VDVRIKKNIIYRGTKAESTQGDERSENDKLKERRWSQEEEEEEEERRRKRISVGRWRMKWKRMACPW